MSQTSGENLTPPNGTCGRCMPEPSTCTICLEFLLLYDNDTAARDASEILKPTVVTRCGHHFHTSCIIKWFKSFENENEDSGLKPCPYCRREMRWCDIKRTFPLNMNMITNPEDESYRNKRPDPATCTVCYEYILAFDFDNRGEVVRQRPYVTTKCGHLFHTICINEWFKQAHGDDPELKPCPYCKREMRQYELKRIFPTSSGED